MAASSGFFFGKMRHWRSTEDLYVMLMDSAGSPATGLTLSTNVEIYMEAPDDSAITYHTASPNPWTEIGNGMYRLLLYGSQAGASPDVIDQAGRYGIRFVAVANAFEDVGGFYDVASDIKVSFGAAYVPGTGGTDKIKGAILLTKWWSEEEFVTADWTALTALRLRIRDPDGTAYVDLTYPGDIGSGLTFGSNVIWVDTSPAQSVTGGLPLNALIEYTYKGHSAVANFPGFGRFGA